MWLRLGNVCPPSSIQWKSSSTLCIDRQHTKVGFHKPSQKSWTVEWQVWATERRGNLVRRTPHDDQSSYKYRKDESSPSLVVKNSLTLSDTLPQCRGPHYTSCPLVPIQPSYVSGLKHLHHHLSLCTHDVAHPFGKQCFIHCWETLDSQAPLLGRLASYIPGHQWLSIPLIIAFPKKSLHQSH